MTTLASDDQIACIREYKWRQGSIIPDAIVDEVLSFLPPHISFSKKDDLLLVASHDCDVVSTESEKEPFVELIVAHRAESYDGNKGHGKNSRALHLLFEGETTCFELKAFDKFFAVRTVLARACPKSAGFSDQGLRTLRFWLGNRYNRDGFPDDFNNLLGASENRRLRRNAEAAFKSKEIGELTTAIFLKIDPEGELSDSQSYSVFIVATMPRSKYEDQANRELVEAQLSKFAGALDFIEGIQVDDHTVVSDASFSIEDVRLSLRFNFDSLSLRSDESDDPPTL